MTYTIYVCPKCDRQLKVTGWCWHDHRPVPPVRKEVVPHAVADELADSVEALAPGRLSHRAGSEPALTAYRVLDKYREVVS